MLVLGALFLVVLGASAHGMRTTGGGPRWPFLVASTLAGSAILPLLIGMSIALTAGSHTWNRLVNGSQSRETVTLWLMLVVGPILLATCSALLITGAVLRTRHRRRSEQASPE